MRAIVFGIFAAIVISIFVNLSDGAFELNASMNDHYSRIEQQLSE